MAQIDTIQELGGRLRSWRTGDDADLATSWRLSSLVDMAGTRAIETKNYYITETTGLARKNFLEQPMPARGNWTIIDVTQVDRLDSAPGHLRQKHSNL